MKPHSPLAGLPAALALVAAVMFSGAAAAAVHCVPDMSPGGCTDSFATITLAITASAAAGDTVKVAPGTYAENLVVAKSILFVGAQTGVDARGRVAGAPSPATESIIAPAAGTGLLLQTGSAGTSIDGFSFSGGTRGIESNTGPINNLQILNNSFKTFTSNAVFLNDPGLDITVQFNAIDGASQVGGGAAFHLDTDGFNGFQFLDNTVANSPNTGLFVDGNHNINVNGMRAPMIVRNVFMANGTGANLGSRAFNFGSIVDNTFESNVFDGLQGGIQNTAITTNIFRTNGRSGLALTSFGNAAADRGGQNSTITCNAFIGNVAEGIFLSATQAVGTIATNTINSNNIFSNTLGLRYGGTETINAESNFWGSATGPTHPNNPGGTGDAVATTPANATTVDYVPFATAGVPCVPVAGQPPPPPDLSITKTDGVATAIPGGSVTYTIVASNASAGNATGATVTDTFPASLTATWTCVGTLGGTCTAAGSGNISDTVNLPAGGSVTYTVSATISAAATGSLSNTATVATPPGVTDPDPANNSATDIDTLTPQADLSITKTDGVTAVLPGGSVTYTIVASNAGLSNATGATVTDTFPASLAATWTCVGTLGGTCTAAGAGNISDTVNLPAGGSVTYTVSATVSPSATGTLSNTATVTAPPGVTDSNQANNSATDTDTVTAVPDLSITKTASGSGVAGTNVTYVVTVTNSGLGVANSVVVTDLLPAGLTFVSATPSQGTYDPVTGIWSVGT
ncbi:MAG: DUF11 domain-containing protein, partial [Burkholderiales bacterium]|nr:DUF11 domain-containing protein [Burkholderiales bacterium]